MAPSPYDIAVDGTLSASSLTHMHESLPLNARSDVSSRARGQHVGLSISILCVSEQGRLWQGSTEPQLLENSIRSKISCTGSNIV